MKELSTIDEISTHDLIAELENRFELLIILGKKHEDGNVGNSFFSWTGTHEVSMACAQELWARIQRAMIREEIVNALREVDDE